jgi:hypothetical protein
MMRESKQKKAMKYLLKIFTVLNAYMMLVGKSEGKRLLGRPRSR